MSVSTQDAETACTQLRSLVSAAVAEADTDALLLSGGLDTSILAAVSAAQGTRTTAITVALAGTRAPDLRYARRIAQQFCAEHHVIYVTVDAALEKLSTVIEMLRTFDPALPNDLVIYTALDAARQLGITRVMTGDAADELFAGYSYMHALSSDVMRTYVTRIAKTMHFASNSLGASLDIAIQQPYRNQQLMEFALSLDPAVLVREHGQSVYGKWLLRTAFEPELGELAWRAKDPIEVGSGAAELREVIRRTISDTEFEAKKQRYSMAFMNKEQLYFYEIYRAVVGAVPQGHNKRRCPLCRADLPANKLHCAICGFAYPLTRYLTERSESV
ncbi:MAG: 7-cyano-7-deazaguanine synthase [Methanomicrobia archaeon]|nr:7-cyano-7-deazaguanine synthase [Methanomicrobia archaeon]